MQLRLLKHQQLDCERIKGIFLVWFPLNSANTHSNNTTSPALFRVIIVRDVLMSIFP